ncbi:MAG TPA: hypothetical protein VJR02_20785 [Pyrinomonadaceae bacterium]|nr:hypothetical protein [Pyrinomonadaceae bacterium]
MENALTNHANVRHLPAMSIAAHIAGTQLGAMKQTVAAVILIASDCGVYI